MNQDNFEYLKKGLANLGFGDQLNKELEANISKKTPEFQLEFKKNYGRETVDFTLDFRKSDTSEMYFFNRYSAGMVKDLAPLETRQTFYVNKNKGITTDEAFNLLSGRAVNKDLFTKEGKEYNAWVQLDFNDKDQHDNHKMKQYSAGYGYDVHKALTRYPIKELSDEQQKNQLVKALKSGDVVPVTFSREGKEDKMFVEANPQYKTLNLYDSSMKKVYQENAKKEGQSQREPEKKQERPEKKDVDEGDRKQKPARQRTVRR